MEAGMIDRPRIMSSKMGLEVQHAESTDDLIQALDYGAALIRARDREVISKCKTALFKTLAAYILPNRVQLVLSGSDLDRISEALDSVLREIE
jgi:dihydroneopterin aldolase